MQKADDPQSLPKPQPLTRPILETETTLDDYDLFLAKWDRYRDGCFRPNHHDALEIALQI